MLKKIKSFKEKPAEWINAGFFVLSKEVINRIDGDNCAWEEKPMESLASEGQFSVYFHKGFWQPMDTLRDKMKLNIDEIKNIENEYANAIDLKSIDVDVVTPTFKDFKNGKHKFISFYAKKARGMMADFIIRNKVKAPSKLLSFDCGGYYYCPESSSPNLPVFLRD